MGYSHVFHHLQVVTIVKCVGAGKMEGKCYVLITDSVDGCSFTFAAIWEFSFYFLLLN
jgi:hypothetical protein